MSDFVWRLVSVAAVSVLSVLPFALTESVSLLFAGLFIGVGAVVALSQIGRE